MYQTKKYANTSCCLFQKKVVSKLISATPNNETSGGTSSNAFSLVQGINLQSLWIQTYLPHGWPNIYSLLPCCLSDQKPRVQSYLKECFLGRHVIVEISKRGCNKWSRLMRWGTGPQIQLWDYTAGFETVCLGLLHQCVVNYLKERTGEMTDTSVTHTQAEPSLIAGPDVFIRNIY